MHGPRAPPGIQSMGARPVRCVRQEPPSRSPTTSAALRVLRRAGPWSSQSLGRLRTVAILHGRERLAEAVEAQGFPLR